MRDFKSMKRQRGRNRGGGNNKPQQNANRSFESNGPEGIKVRGAAPHVLERYQQLARDAASAGDRVLAENYLQHAEHYYRTVRILQPQRPASDFVARDPFAPAFDFDLEETEGGEAPEGAEVVTQPQPPAEEPRQGDRYEREPRREFRDRDDRYRDNREFRDRDDRPRNERYQRDDREQRGDRWDRNRDDRPREDRPREDRPREERYSRDDREPRGERFERNRDDRYPAREDRYQRDDRPREERAEGEARPARRDREREYRDDRGPRPSGRYGDGSAAVNGGAPAEEGGVLRSQDGAVSELPGFLQAAVPAPAPDATTEDAPAPKRTRTRKPKAEAPATEEA